MKERWLPVVGYETTYKISDHGRVKRIGRAKGARKGLILSPYMKSNGYMTIALCVNDEVKKHSIHRLVLAAFDKPMPSHIDGRHKDGTRANNHISNLQWGTRAENMQDAVNHGRTLRGTKNKSAKLDEEKVRKIRDDTRLQAVIAADYGVGPDIVSRVKSRKAWGWVV